MSKYRQFEVYLEGYLDEKLKKSHIERTPYPKDLGSLNLMYSITADLSLSLVARIATLVVSTL